MREEEAYIGARVVAVNAVDHHSGLIGLEGTIVRLGSPSGMFEVGVQFDQNIEGHECHGAGKDGHCRYGNFGSFKLIDDNPLDLDMSFDQMFNG